MDRLGREEEARQREAGAAGLEAAASNGGDGRGGLIDGAGQPGSAPTVGNGFNDAGGAPAARDPNHIDSIMDMMQGLMDEQAGWREGVDDSLRELEVVDRRLAGELSAMEMRLRLRFEGIIERRVANASTWDLEQILADNDSAGELASRATSELKWRKIQLRSIGNDAAAAGVARILVKWGGRQERVVGEEEDVGALRREVADLRQRNEAVELQLVQVRQSDQALEQRVATLERLLDVGTMERRMAAAREHLLGVDGTGEDGSDADLIGEDVDGVLA